MKKGFTLIEILVVVLIIGILAAIAVPQYQVAVTKSRYATLKFKTKAIAEAVNTYILATGNYPKNFRELDINLEDVSSYSTAQEGTTDIWVFFNKGGHCGIWINGWNKVACFNTNSLAFYFDFDTLKPEYCYAPETYKTENIVCQQDTGKSSGSCPGGSYCLYYY